MFKYKVSYNGTVYQGNSIDAIAGYITKDFPEVSFSEAVRYVNTVIIPVTRGASKEVTLKERQGNSKVTLSDIMSGAKSALKQIVGDTVKQDEINRRANICLNCPMKSEVSLCIPCGQGSKLLSFVRSIKKWWSKSHKIPHDLDHNYCSVCNCSLGMMLPAPIEHFTDKERTNRDRPKFCWVKQS